MKSFVLKSPYEPGGDQPEAIAKLVESVRGGNDHQVLLGVTGSGKTFTLAKVIEKLQMPVLVISHNKTLAGQLYQEFRDFFPDNAVAYFVSYYDYYQPEAYIPQTDTYIEKETDVNEEIDKLRLAATANLLTRPDVIVVASVSCIYNLGSPVEYGKNMLELVEGEVVERQVVVKRLVELQYERTGQSLERGSFRVRGKRVEVWPADKEMILRLVFGEKKMERWEWLEPLEMTPLPHGEGERRVVITPAKHFLADVTTRSVGLSQIKQDLKVRLEQLRGEGKVLEAQRLERRVSYDIEMIEEMGYVNGIENYSRYFDGRGEGDPPFTLMDYMRHNAQLFGKKGFLTVVDESHMSLPQIRGMYRGDLSRKQTLVEYGFRLPSALDNRPLRFEEWGRRVGQTVYVSATPGEYELGLAAGSGGVAEQLLRPTGLLEPEIEVRPIEGQVRDLVGEIVARKERGERVLVTTLTKRMAEELAEYLQDESRAGVKLGVHYIHADVQTLDRADILDDLRLGEVDVVVGINLLREGLDLPEVSLVAILDADKEGFLRSNTALIQTMGRAARHKEGRVILYADVVTGSMAAAMAEVRRRRVVQEAFNKKHGIEPVSVVKPVREKLLVRESQDARRRVAELAEWGWEELSEIDAKALTPADKKKLVVKLKKRMNEAAKNWEFEAAAKYRDAVEKLGMV